MAGITEFVTRRKPAWDRLSTLLARAGSGGVRSLSRDDLQAIGPLYRRTAADLAYARLRGADANLVASLNDLVGRAHGLLYAERGPGFLRLWGFIAVGFPRLIRQRRAYILLATAVFFLGGILGAGLTAANPKMLRVFVGERADDPGFYKNLDIQDPSKPIFSAMLMQNNIRVAFLAFAVGMLGGFPTLLLLFYNGLPIGALAVQQHRFGYDLPFWSFILPHGITELTAIFIAGGAGMLVGHALIAPGELSRRDALTVAGRDAARLILGTILLFVVAGLIEAFISPTRLPPIVKLPFAALTAIALWAYFRAGRTPTPDASASL